MSAGIAVTDKGKRKVYTAKTFEDMTIADWRKLTSPQLPDLEGRDMAVELISRHCTVPKAILRKMPVKEVTRLMDAIEQLNVDVAEARKKADTDPVPDSFTHKGVTYVIPKSIEAEVAFGQFEDLEKVVLPKCETDADIHKAILAFLCLPEGEEYDGEVCKKRADEFETVKVSLSMTVYAFFFGSSEQFRTLTLRYLSRTRNTA